MQCTNQLKQIGLAVQNYHDPFKSFPAAGGWVINQRTISATPAVQAYELWGTMLFICPFIEQQARYDTVMNRVVDGAAPWTYDEAIRPWWGWSTTMSYPGYAGQIAAIRCPSDGQSFPGHLAPRSNYMFSRGDVGYGTNPWQNREGTVTLPAYDPDSSNNWGQKCASYAVKRGMFGLHHWKTMGSVTDGTSNTIAVSEGLVSDGSRDVKRNLGQSIEASPDNAPLARCGKAVLTADGVTFLDSVTVFQNGDVNIQSCRGIRGFAAQMTYSGFNTVFPPNSPQCMASNGAGEGGWGFFSPTSNHTGGVNAAYVDGSVHFISDTIDCGNLAHAEGARGGQSWYGAWGALGSINGRESRDVP